MNQLMELTPEKHIKFLQSRLRDTIEQKRSAIRKFERLRRQTLPKLICVEFNQKDIDTQNDLIRNLLRENEMLYKLNDSLEKRAVESETAAYTSEEISKLYQAELESLHTESDKLKKQIYTLQQKLNIRESEIRSIKSATGLPILVRGYEQDLYTDEQKDLVIEILEQALQNSIEGSRKHDVLKSILKANPEIGVRKSLKAKLISWFHSFKGWDYTGIERKKEFLDMGFNLVSKKNHIKFIFKGDNRYPIVLASTPTDTRSPMNTMSDTVKKIF